MIRLEQVHKCFRSGKKDVQALVDFSMEVKPGLVYGLLGPNGAGKTTALRIIATLLKPDAGVVTVNELDARRDPGQARRHIGFLTGDTKLYDRLTPRETLRYFGSLYEMIPGELDGRIAELARMLQMDDYLDRRMGRLSTGQKQKLSIARAVIHNPAVIVLDEPTSGLDVIASRNVVEFILQSGSEGKTVLFSTHILSEAERICQDIGMIHLGRMLLEDSLSTIKAVHPGNTLEDIFLELVENHEEEPQ
ncbi:MAG: ATP-binding cassette domain-containing protein [Candidatus Delongbacteria bacterium]|nr:ATP-binding cassette domain-containing protein [Candidatus Delongbacteria bacterium]